MPEFEHDGLTFHYETAGSPETPPVLLLHGLTGDLRVWHPVVEELSDAYWPIALDLRGHGLSTVPEGLDSYTMDAYAGDVRALLDHLNVEVCALVGTGFGGMVALHVAVTWPERVAALIASDASPAAECNRYDDAYRERERGIEEMVELVTRKGTAQWGRRRAAAIRDPFLAEGVRRRCASMRADGIAGAAHARRTRPDLIPLLRERLTMPVLLVTGEQDPVRCAFEVMCDEVRDARALVFRDTPHGVPAAKPDAFLRAVVQFLADVEQGKPVAGRRSI